MARWDGVDVRLIDPDVPELVATLKQAHAAANEFIGVREARLERDDAFWHRFARDCLRERQGRRRSCRAGYFTPEVIAGWWTDSAGRRHFRVIGRTRQRYQHVRAESELRDLPPWWHVYPESVLAVRGPTGKEQYLACCRCGRIGIPETLGWMGDCCGPCFDQRSEGQTVVIGYGHIPHWRMPRHGRLSATAPAVVFSGDGTALIGQHVDGRIRRFDLRDGTETCSRSAWNHTVVAAADRGSDCILVGGNGGVYRWPVGTASPLRVLNGPPHPGLTILSPDGNRLLILGPWNWLTADLSRDRPLYRATFGSQQVISAAFPPDGRWAYAVTASGGLLRLNPAELTETVLLTNLFAGLPAFGQVHALAVAPGGMAAAVSRQTYYPQTFRVRVIPLGSQRSDRAATIIDLPLPPWHQPTVLAFAPDGQHLLTGDPSGGWVGIWKLPGCRPLGFLRAVPEDPGWRNGQLLFSRDGRTLAVFYTGFNAQRGCTMVLWPWPDVLHAACETITAATDTPDELPEPFPAATTD